MSHAQLCPVCGGWGKVPSEYNDFQAWNRAFEPKNPKECHGCNSKGWILISEFTYWAPFNYSYSVPLLFPPTDLNGVQWVQPQSTTAGDEKKRG